MTTPEAVLIVRFERAINPVLSLRSIVEEMRKEGLKKEEIYQALENFRDILQAQDRGNDEDVVLDVMDFLTGWCNPHMKIK